MLVVDDEDSICELLRGYFESRGATVVTCPTAEVALQRLVHEESFDILFIDKNLPGMTGVELIRQVREADEDVAILMITGYSSAESIIDTLNLGIDAYVEKPFKSLGEISALTDAILRRRTLSSAAPTLDPDRTLHVIGAIDDAGLRTSVAEALSRVRVNLLCVRTEAELLLAVGGDPDVVLFDTLAWRHWSPATVERVAEKAPFAAAVVLSAGNLATKDLRKLIDLGVLALFEVASDPDWRRKLGAAVERILVPPHAG